MVGMIVEIQMVMVSQMMKMHHYLFGHTQLEQWKYTLVKEFIHLSGNILKMVILMEDQIEFT